MNWDAIIVGAFGVCFILWLIYHSRNTCPDCGNKFAWGIFGGTERYTFECIKCQMWYEVKHSTGKIVCRRPKPKVDQDA